MAATAIRPGTRATSRGSRYQKPLSAGRASRSACRARKRGVSPSTRRPSRVRIAGSTVSAIAAAIRATKSPAIPIEYRKRCGNTRSEASAPATVIELKSTVRPAVARVRPIASVPGPVRASSSR